MESGKWYLNVTYTWMSHKSEDKFQLGKSRNMVFIRRVYAPKILKMLETWWPRMSASFKWIRRVSSWRWSSVLPNHGSYTTPHLHRNCEQSRVKNLNPIPICHEFVRVTCFFTCKEEPLPVELLGVNFKTLRLPLYSLLPYYSALHTAKLVLIDTWHTVKISVVVVYTTSYTSTISCIVHFLSTFLIRVPGPV